MELDKQTEKEITRSFRLSERDTQSADVQIAILTERIHQLMDEVRRMPFDRTIRMFLMNLVAKRRKLLTYLQATDTARYLRMANRLGLQA